jgi:hypothetical protein
MKKYLGALFLFVSSSVYAGLFVEGNIGSLKSVDKTYNNPREQDINSLPLWYTYGFRLGNVYRNSDLSFGYTIYDVPSVNASVDGLLSGDLGIAMYDFQALAVLPVCKDLKLKVGGSIGYAEFDHKIAQFVKERYRTEIYITETLENQIFETFSAGLEYKIAKYLSVNLTAKYLLLNTIRTRKETAESDMWVYQDIKRINLNSLIVSAGIRVYLK